MSYDGPAPGRSALDLKMHFDEGPVETPGRREGLPGSAPIPKAQRVRSCRTLFIATSPPSARLPANLAARAPAYSRAVHQQVRRDGVDGRSTHSQGARDVGSIPAAAREVRHHGPEAPHRRRRRRDRELPGRARERCGGRLCATPRFPLRQWREKSAGIRPVSMDSEPVWSTRNGGSSR